MKQENEIKEHLLAGYGLTCCGDARNIIYKQSKEIDSLANKVAKHVLKFPNVPYKIIPFSVGGIDERQYCSSGLNLSIGSLTRSIYSNTKNIILP